MSFDIVVIQGTLKPMGLWNWTRYRPWLLAGCKSPQPVLAGSPSKVAWPTRSRKSVSTSKLSATRSQGLGGAQLERFLVLDQLAEHVAEGDGLGQRMIGQRPTSGARPRRWRRLWVTVWITLADRRQLGVVEGLGRSSGE